ncbi:MAG: DnaD domain protein [Firmicutes bacterium]|nr:DnaD domain protein [Bacillota bacterium]
MAFRHEKTSDLFLKETGVENMFINEYMAAAPGDFVKVYLIAQMYADAGLEISNEAIAKTLGIEHEDVLKAWTYWEKKGIVRKIFAEDKSRLEYDVEFINLREQLYGSKSVKMSSEQSLQSSMADKDIQEMLSEIEKMTGSVMNGTEVTEIVGWLSDYNIAPDVIIYAYRYSLDRKRKNIKYIEAVIRNWAEEGLLTVEAISRKLSENDRKQHLYRRVFQALGFIRNATEEERRIMDTWFDTMGFSLEKVLEACKKTSGISSPNINYVNKVLTNWYEEQNSAASSGGKSEVTSGDVSRYYEALREKEMKEAEARRQEVYSKVPRIREIEETLGASAAEMAMAIANGRSDRDKLIAETKARNDAMNIEEAFLLTDNGFDIDYMDVKYSCENCKDTGVLETGERCQCFGEVTREKIDLLMKQVK